MFQEILEKYQINIIKCFFINSTLMVVLFGVLINKIESQLPAIISQSIRYGKMSHKGQSNPLVSRFEIPKSWFRHFYIFAFIWSLLALILTLKGLINASSAPIYVIDFLDFFAGGKERKVLVNATSGLLATILITMQIARRFYETHFIQIFSSKSKMNLWHYFLGFAHYFGSVVVLLANTEGFVRGTTPSPFSFSKITLMQCICCFIFYFNWSQQYKSNIMLANLRRDDTGDKVTEEYLIPYGGFFEFVSSPHMLFEVGMYAAICGVIPACNTWLYIAIWVIVNQTESAWLTHKWYQKNIKDYPEERYAIYPCIL